MFGSVRTVFSLSPTHPRQSVWRYVLGIPGGELRSVVLSALTGGRLVGESPASLHADLTFAGEPVVSAQSQKKNKHREAQARADALARDQYESVVSKRLT